jgi:hypothetical protein
MTGILFRPPPCAFAPDPDAFAAVPFVFDATPESFKAVCLESKTCRLDDGSETGTTTCGITSGKRMGIVAFNVSVGSLKSTGSRRGLSIIVTRIELVEIPTRHRGHMSHERKDDQSVNDHDDC